ncbi:hypothetical protein D3C73_1433480 [compost metagenome]
MLAYRRSVALGVRGGFFRPFPHILMKQAETHEINRRTAAGGEPEHEGTFKIKRGHRADPRGGTDIGRVPPRNRQNDWTGNHNIGDRRLCGVVFGEAGSHGRAERLPRVSVCHLRVD